jgi:hypothetical protein
MLLDALFALVSASRDTGGHEFDASALAEHLAIHVAGMHASGVSNLRMLFTDLTGNDHESALQRG